MDVSVDCSCYRPCFEVQCGGRREVTGVKQPILLLQKLHTGGFTL